ncbi:alpha/beta-hydrolase family protein [Kineosporia babensis]|uniref:Alpha/beta-hydrolase family protein n=1 Tax=Kineosporia babensis TaxID=499548 RepID=A0A9X1NJA4_9ACTN|nr:alpha/beta-hydrolase family protein [Kineosporia babensis]
MISLPPQLLPRTGLTQAVVGALALLQGYVLAIIAQAGLRRKRLWAREFLGSSVRVPWLMSGFLLLLAAGITHGRALTANQRYGLPDPSAGQTVLVMVGSVALAGGVVRLTGVLRRRSGRTLLVMVGMTALGLGHVVPGRMSTAGDDFLSGLRPAAEISSVTGRESSQPIRVYVPLRTSGAETSDARASEAIRRLQAAGGLSRRAVLVVVPTGSGWVNQRVVERVEELYHGDLATVVVQYSAAPSWLAFLRGGDGVEDSAAALTRAVREQASQLPRRERPLLLAYGESLGAVGLLPTAQGDPLAGIDAALLTGVPGQPVQPRPAVTVLNHSDDPIPGLAPSFPLGPSLSALADAASALEVPVGHGHRYGAETVHRWCLRMPVGVCPDRRHLRLPGPP